MATNSRSNELTFRSRSFQIHKNKSPALGGMSFFIVFVQRRQRRPLLGLSVRLRVRMVVVGLDIVAPHCLMMIAAVAARMHPSTCSRCSGGDALVWLESSRPTFAARGRSRRRSRFLCSLCSSAWFYLRRGMIMIDLAAIREFIAPSSHGVRTLLAITRDF